VVAAAIEAIHTQYAVRPEAAAAWLQLCVEKVKEENNCCLRVDRFFFEDAKYNSIGLAAPTEPNRVRR
jgi:hypothetical protein